MADKPIFLTKEGIVKLETKLAFLKNEKRTEVAARIKAAIALGDLSENSEYVDAKNEQAFLEGEIKELTTITRRAEIIDDASISGDTVVIGAVIEVRDMATKKESEFKLVGSEEADPFGGKISNESPVGLALLGAHIGDTITVKLPNKTRKLKIKAIHK